MINFFNFVIFGEDGSVTSSLEPSFRSETFDTCVTFVNFVTFVPLAVWKEGFTPIIQLAADFSRVGQDFRTGDGMLRDLRTWIRSVSASSFSSA